MSKKAMNVRRTFVTGLLFITPVVVTYWVIRVVVGSINEALTSFIFRIINGLGGGTWMQQAWVNYVAPIVTLLLAAAIIFLVGLVGGNVLGRQLLRALEGLVLRVPVVRGVYSAVRQLVDTFSNPEGRSFQGVVLVEFPRPGTYALGLITAETRGEVRDKIGREVLSVFVPTTPNPTGGYLLFVPKEAVISLSMTIEDALKMVVSGGVLTPEGPARRA